MLDQQDLTSVLRVVPRAVLDLMMRPDVSVVLAGGLIRSVIRGEKPSDVDLFVGDEAIASKLANDLVKVIGGKTAATDNAVTVYFDGKPPVQFIHRWPFTSPEQVLESFDFTIAKAAIWFLQPVAAVAPGEWRSYCDPRFYMDLAAMRLVYLDPPRNVQPGGTILRVLKFVRRGYSISPEHMSAVISRFVCEACGQACPESNLLAAMREVDPLGAPIPITPSVIIPEQEQGEELGI